MLEPKANIFMPRSPGRLRSALAPGARMYGVREWSLIHFQQAGNAPGDRAPDAAAQPPSGRHHEPPDNPHLDGIILLHHSTENTPAECRRQAPQKRGWWGYRQVRWRNAGAECVQ